MLSAEPWLKVDWFGDLKGVFGATVKAGAEEDLDGGGVGRALAEIEGACGGGRR